MSKAENSRVFGKCNNPYGHGHDYVLDVVVTGELDATTGLMVRLADLDNLVKAKVLAAFSYRNLNQDVAEFAGLVPTTENVAIVIDDRLRKYWQDYLPYSCARLSGILIQETERNSFEVIIQSAAVRNSDDTGRVVFSRMNESVIVNA